MISKQALRTTLSWSVVVVGFAFGLLALVLLGSADISFGDRDPGWYLRWVGIAGLGLLGTGFIAGSMVAPRRPRSAGLIFVILMPIAVFCLALPGAGDLVLHANEGGYFVIPLPLAALSLIAVFYLPFAVPLLVQRRRKLALILFAVLGGFAGFIVWRSPWTRVLVPLLAVCSAPFLIFGRFWIMTQRRGWLPLLEPHRKPVARRVGKLSAICLLILCLDAAATLAMAAWRSSTFSGDCSGRGLFARPVYPGQVVFTVHLLRVQHAKRVSGKWVGDWAIGSVQERFWGLPWWSSRLVLLTNGIFWEGDTYLVDGSRAHALLTRALPIVETRSGCSRTRNAIYAAVDLRVLRRPPARGSTLVIGSVTKPEEYVGGLTPPQPSQPLVGAQIILTGPNDTTTRFTTDEEGIYEIHDLPPGDYTLQLLVPEHQVVGFFDEKPPVPLHLNKGDLVQHNFDLFWNGRIEGRVKDSTGQGLHAWVELLKADRSQLPGSVRNFLLTAPDGSYLINKIPPGRYVLLLNSSGPRDEWPHDMQYYPSASSIADAQKLEVTEGQRITGIDFTVPRLDRKTVHVRVTWPDGGPAKDAAVCVAYERTEDYGVLACLNDLGRTNQDGVAVVNLYGRTHVRLFAEQMVSSTSGKEWWITYHNQPLEAAADKVPDHVNLVLTLAEPYGPPKPDDTF